VKKKKTVKKGDKNWASITMQIDENRFHAEGDNAEVQAKLKIWLDEQFAPMRKVKAFIERVSAGDTQK
jgi:hypothetical protein